MKKIVFAIAGWIFFPFLMSQLLQNKQRATLVFNILLNSVYWFPKKFILPKVEVKKNKIKILRVHIVNFLNFYLAALVLYDVA